ncbi:hypothetical protein [Candidatus Manganitrophus noduliformans]|uniref:Uncharacterized protein n=1 Tax=Candidatus Manganitrophus noduliformans TaxID=2606439 RepID=A0A7X6IA30_9BACT|nr:hypothetical protein [Candidatus Manganitrophus noduliformans]NKE70286.1 hypothetical protein [Candidatus Manganitrophus noduliformans]
MAKLICTKCAGERPVPKLDEGPGIVSKKDATKLTCPTHGEQCATTNIPLCCGASMKYTV